MVGESQSRQDEAAMTIVHFLLLVLDFKFRGGRGKDEDEDENRVAELGDFLLQGELELLHVGLRGFVALLLRRDAELTGLIRIARRRSGRR